MTHRAFIEAAVELRVREAIMLETASCICTSRATGYTHPSGEQILSYLRDRPPTMPSDSINSLHFETLMSELGQALYDESETMLMRPPNSRQLIELARQWIESQNGRIQDLLLNDPQIHALAYDAKTRDLERLVTLFADGLTAPFTGFPMTTAALVIVHFYLDHYITLADSGEDKVDE